MRCFTFSCGTTQSQCSQITFLSSRALAYGFYLARMKNNTVAHNISNQLHAMYEINENVSFKINKWQRGEMWMCSVENQIIHPEPVRIVVDQTEEDLMI